MIPHRVFTTSTKADRGAPDLRRHAFVDVFVFDRGDDDMRGLNKMAKKTVCKTCAFTGYRPQKMPWGEDEGSPLCVAFKARLNRALESIIGDGYVTFLSGCARGFDTMPAEAVLELPDSVRAFAIFPYGYPAEERKQQDRFDESRIHYVE